MPPDAWRHAAAVQTAAIISMTSIGGSVGRSPNTNASSATPRPPIMPSPAPPTRAPTKIIPSTTASSIHSMGLSPVRGRIISPCG